MLFIIIIVTINIIIIINSGKGGRVGQGITRQFGFIH